MVAGEGFEPSKAKPTDLQSTSKSPLTSTNTNGQPGCPDMVRRVERGVCLQQVDVQIGLGYIPPLATESPEVLAGVRRRAGKLSRHGGQERDQNDERPAGIECPHAPGREHGRLDRHHTECPLPDAAAAHA